MFARQVPSLTSSIGFKNTFIPRSWIVSIACSIDSMVALEGPGAMLVEDTSGWNHQKLSATVSVPKIDMLSSDWSEPAPLSVVCAEGRVRHTLVGRRGQNGRDRQPRQECRESASSLVLSFRSGCPPDTLARRSAQRTEPHPQPIAKHRGKGSVNYLNTPGKKYLVRFRQARQPAISQPTRDQKGEDSGTEIVPRICRAPLPADGPKCNFHNSYWSLENSIPSPSRHTV